MAGSKKRVRGLLLVEKKSGSWPIGSCRPNHLLLCAGQAGRLPRVVRQGEAAEWRPEAGRLQVRRGEQTLPPTMFFRTFVLFKYFHYLTTTDKYIVSDSRKQKILSYVGLSMQKNFFIKLWKGKVLHEFQENVHVARKVCVSRNWGGGGSYI